jgi:topoisomerase-4 subunit A
MLLGEFKGDDKIVVWTAKNQYYITNFDVQQHFPDDTIRVERYVADRVYALCYYDGEQNYYYMKRFQLEDSDKTQFFLEEGAPMRFVTISYAKGAKLEVIFGGQHEQRATELIDVDAFIGIKSHRAKGKRISTYEIAMLNFIEPEIVEESEDEAFDEDIMEGADVEVDGDVEFEDVIDADELLDEDIKADPNIDYASKAESEDVGFSAEQLNLF